MSLTFEERVWSLHVQGYAPSQIAETVGCSEEEARRCVVRHWLNDRQMSRR